MPNSRRENDPIKKVEAELFNLRKSFTKLLWDTTGQYPYQEIGELPAEFTKYSPDFKDLYKGDDLVLRGEPIKICTFMAEKGRIFPFHREYYDEVYTVYGHVRISIPGRRDILVGPSDHGVIKAHVPHKWEFLEDTIVHLAWFDIAAHSK